MERQDTGISVDNELLMNNDKHLDSETDESNQKMETRKKYNKFMELMLFIGFQTTSATKQTGTLDAIMTIIETCQMISLIIASPSNNLLRGSTTVIIRNLISYTTAEAITRMVGFTPIEFAISVTTGSQMIVYFLLPVYLMRITGQKDFDPSKIYNHKTTKYLGYYFRIYRPILLVPIFNLSMSIFACTNTKDYIVETPGLQCWQGDHLGFTFMAAISTLLCLISLLFLALLYKDLNPLNKDLVNGYLQMGKNFKLLAKIITIIIVNLAISSVATISLPFILISLILSLWLNPKPFEIIMWGLVVWTSFCSTIQSFIPDSSEVYYLICIPVVSLFLGLMSNHLEKGILETNPSKEYLAVRQLLKVIHLMESHTSITNLNLLQTFILWKNQRNSKAYKLYTYKYVAKILGILHTSEIPGEDENTKRQKICYMFVNKLCKELREMYPKSADLLVIHSHISKDRLKNNYQSYYLMRSIERQNSSSIYYISECRSIRNQIEANLNRDEAQITEENGLSLAKIATFHKILSRLKENLIKASDVLYEFWSEVQAAKPLIAHLITSSSQAVKLNFSAGKLFKLLQAMSPNNIKLLRLYGMFVGKVKGDHQLGRSLLITAMSQTRNLKKSKVNPSISLRCSKI